MNQEEVGVSLDDKPPVEKQEKRKHNYSAGQLLTFVRVRFPGHVKSYPFLIGKKNLHYGEKVVAMSDRGMAVGYINSFPYEIKFEEKMLPIRTISKSATDDDVKEQIENYKKEKEAEILCKRLINKHELSMNLTHVEFTQFGKKCVFYFTAPARVDFRNLVKDLVSELKIRIELRQISVRDRAAAVGGIGSCGRQLCCSSFLEKYGQVNLRMAKSQDLSINFDKLNGVCGQIKCCIKYEEEVYAEKRKKLPKDGSLVTCKNGDQGKVLKTHIIIECFDMMTDKGVRKRYNFDQLLERNAKFKMPGINEFEHISDETGTVVGYENFKVEANEKLQEELKVIEEEEKGFSDGVFQELFETTSIKDTYLS